MHQADRLFPPTGKSCGYQCWWAKRSKCSEPENWPISLQVDEQSLDAQVLNSLIFCVGGTVVSGGEKNELWKHCLSWANSLWMCWLRMEQWLKCVVVSSSPSVSLCSSRISSTFSDPSAGEDHSDWWCCDSDMWGHPVAWTQSSSFGSHLEISTGRRVDAGTCLMEPAAMIRPVISQGSKARLKAGIWHWAVVFQHVFPIPISLSEEKVEWPDMSLRASPELGWIINVLIWWPSPSCSYHCWPLQFS